MRVPGKAGEKLNRSSSHPIWILPSIAAAVIGGVSTTGGIDNPVRAMLGARIIGFVKNIIVFFRVSPYWQSVASGQLWFSRYPSIPHRAATYEKKNRKDKIQ